MSLVAVYGHEPEIVKSYGHLEDRMLHAQIFNPPLQQWILFSNL